jgi:glutamate-1-semialdehyde 2,1-aminomutase
MTPADTVITETEKNSGPGAMSHDEYYAMAAAALPGAGLGGYSLPEDVRFIIHKGEGARLQDVRGNWYIDYVCGAGALILGHAHPDVVTAAGEQVAKGLHFFGTLNELAIQLAAELVEAIPCADKIVFATTGSEATQYAMRMARAFTGRSNILKFEGGYHGNHDYSNFSVTPRDISNYPAGQPDTGGIPAQLHSSVLIAPYNDLDTTRRIVEQNRDDLAAIIVEPAQRIIFPHPDFLPGLRKICDDNGVLLIFDEVVTGFRLAWGGAQEYFGVLPDIASYGKIVGGGGPAACVGARADIIDLCNPKHKGKADYAYVNGTLHGNPVAAAAGLATLNVLKQPGAYKTLNDNAAALRQECQKLLDRHNISALALGEASLWQIMFTDRVPANHADVMHSDGGATRALDFAMMAQGIYVLPGVRRFVSLVHGAEELEQTARAFDAACRAVK